MLIADIINLLGMVGFAVGLSATVWISLVKNAPPSEWLPLAASSMGFAVWTGEFIVAYPSQNLLLRAAAVTIFLLVEFLGVYFSTFERGTRTA